MYAYRLPIVNYRINLLGIERDSKNNLETLSFAYREESDEAGIRFRILR